MIAEQVENIQSAIDAILAIVTSPSWSWQELENSLWVVSTFFREQKFSTVVLPVLNKLAEEDADIWKTAKIWDTQMPLTPKEFENMKASTVQVTGKYKEILCALEQERELALLSIYGITLQVLGEVFRILSKNQQ